MRPPELEIFLALFIAFVAGGFVSFGVRERAAKPQPHARRSFTARSLAPKLAKPPATQVMFNKVFR